MPLGTDVLQFMTAVQDNGTAITQGQVVVFNSVTDATKGVRATALQQAKVMGLAYEDSPGQNKEFRVVRRGVGLGKASATITQGDVLVSAAAGTLVTRTASAAVASHIVGIALESAVAGDLFAVDVNPVSINLA